MNSFEFLLAGKFPFVLLLVDNDLRNFIGVDQIDLRCVFRRFDRVVDDHHFNFIDCQRPGNIDGYLFPIGKLYVADIDCENSFGEL